MSLSSIANLVARFNQLGATRIFFKRLAENDNSKQQIYLGGSFEVLSFFPYRTVTEHPEVKYPNFKAKISLFWVTDTNAEEAKGAQLILYPQYPEVRLSGFLQGCSIAPSAHMQPIPADDRKGFDNRVLFFGTTQDGRTLAYLGVSASHLSIEAIELAKKLPSESVFFELTPSIQINKTARDLVIEAIKDIHLKGFHSSIRLDSQGNIVPYTASNGGGYTLEALLGIKPNGYAAPDYLGWEIKSFSKDRITVMTPEPNGGFYRKNGVEAFVRKYGRQVEGKDQLYFTGNHQCGLVCPTTGLTIDLSGFDSTTGKIIDVSGAIRLLDSVGNEAATWAFSNLLTHWNKKHASAAYVRYEGTKTQPREYQYQSPIYMGEHTDFTKYLSAFAAGKIVFDPGSKVDKASTKRSLVKARSQFRIHRKNLAVLYELFNEVEL